MAPADRVTPRLIWPYLRELHRRGNMPTTIIGRDRRAAHGAADPRARHRHGLDQAPRGRSVYAMLVKRRRTLLVPDAFVLGQWARDIMAAAEQDLDDPRNQAAFRDGCSSACSPAGPGASAR